MSNKTNQLANEIEHLLTAYGNRWHTVEALLQMIDREKIIALNKYLSKRGEPEIVPEPQRYENSREIGWIIPVPQEWYSLTGKEK